MSDKDKKKNGFYGPGILPPDASNQWSVVYEDECYTVDHWSNGTYLGPMLENGMLDFGSREAAQEAADFLNSRMVSITSI